jgi:hypothetical protein
MVKDKAVTENTIVFNQLIIFKNIMSLGKFQQLTAGTVVFKIRLRFLKKRHQNILDVFFCSYLRYAALEERFENLVIKTRKSYCSF